MQRVDSLEKTLMLGGIGGRRRRRWQRMRWLDDITDLMGMNLSRLQEFVMDRETWCAVIYGVAKSRTRLRDWTELNWTEHSFVYIYHIFFIHSSIGGPLGCFHVLAIVNRAAMNKRYTCHFELWFCLGICSIVGLLDHMVVLFLVF